MKKFKNGNMLIGAFLILLSLFLHYIHYLVFKDAHHTLIFLFADIAFIPMEVFFTTLFIDKLLEKRERAHIVEKLSLLIGVFFTEVGTKLLNQFTIGDKNINNIRNMVDLDKLINDADYFKNIKLVTSKYDYKIDLNNIDLTVIKNSLHESKNLLVILISNEYLHDHETFTETIMALFHLKEEIDTRYNLDIQEYEKEHLESDISQVYRYLTYMWCHYINYLSYNYPSLYIKALINNPFDTRSKKEKDGVYLKHFNVYK
ncbi:hypothetical protein [Romboutsia sp. 1001713B170131_170501_G6]|uniref:hypothetical protein n=1 Tax=Romboutsia sp. 1001713B170131_170501_G6 TaxID=2787108 RepID=UPI0018AB4854|nr:hypothetical protein [Romboutsia sp. 1001713B170131_170501_G6]